MDPSAWFTLVLFGLLLTLAARPLGTHMAKVYRNEPQALESLFGPLEKRLYRLGGIDPSSEMDWKTYALAMVLLNIAGGIVLYGLLRAQSILPLNPVHLWAVPPSLSLHTAISFITNTNFQFYSGETSLTYLTQMAGLTTQNFLSCASGMATLVALIRGVARHETDRLGNFWVDLTRGVLYILLPLSVPFAVFLVWQGVPQTLSSAQKVVLTQKASLLPHTSPAREGTTPKPPVATEQTIARGPVASQTAIKMLGTNGGGFFNANSAHPFENPTPLSNFLETLAILLIPAALCVTFGIMVGAPRQGRSLLLAMFLLFLPPTLLCMSAEQYGNPFLAARAAGADGRLPGSGNLEGKELRFGVASSALWASVTTAASNGSVNAMLDSFTPLGGLVPMWMMMLGEVVFGGAGSGLYGMLAFVILTDFVAGLMVGRTPEYLGKKLQAFEMKMVALSVLTPLLLSLSATALRLSFPAGGAGILNPGAHGFSEVLCAFTSMANNNGSAFAGFNGNNLDHLLGAFCMWFGRFFLAIPALAIAGSLARKKVVPGSAGTLPTHTPLFILMLCCVVVIVGALTFVPALALGPIAEHLQGLPSP